MFPACRSSRICFLAATLLGAAAAPAETPLEVAAGTPAATAEPAPVWPAALADDPLAPLIRRALDLAEGPAREAAAVYAQRGYAPVWMTADGAPRIAALLAALEDAASHALPVARYAPERLRAAAADPDPEGRAAAELALTGAFLRYATDLSSGLVDPRRVAPTIRRAAPRPDPATLLRAAAAAGDMAAHLAGLAPADPDYARLRDVYATLVRAAADDATAPRLPEGETIRPGERSARIATLRGRLALRGAVPAPETGDPLLYDGALVAAVRDFQRAHGLAADGAIGRQTRAALNGGTAARAAQIAVNLERIRWLNIDKGARRIEVNLPEFMVTLRDGDEILFRDRVVVGKLENQTPEFSDEMEYLVLNPTWHVPSSIAISEILPKLRDDPGYLARRSMRLVRTDGSPAPDPLTHDFSQYSAGNFPYRIRQTPNDDNALGAVKMMFPNDHAIYLHDTPRKDLFDKPVRAFSFGCVRVRNPLTLAELLVAPQESDPAAFVARVLASGRERYVNLERRVPVHILYRTIVVEPSGALRALPDVYGRDAALLDALRRAGLEAPEA